MAILLYLNEINQTIKKSFGELYFKTFQREEDLRKAGYNLITIWESDWKKLKKELDDNVGVFGSLKVEL